jgi:hypothetical protein
LMRSRSAGTGATESSSPPLIRNDAVGSVRPTCDGAADILVLFFFV